MRKLTFYSIMLLTLCAVALLPQTVLAAGTQYQEHTYYYDSSGNQIGYGFMVFGELINPDYKSVATTYVIMFDDDEVEEDEATSVSLTIGANIIF